MAFPTAPVSGAWFANHIDPSPAIAAALSPKGSATLPAPRKSAAPLSVPVLPREVGAMLAGLRQPLPLQGDDALYAEIKTGAQIIARITNNGYVSTATADYHRIAHLPSVRGEVEGKGPKLAEARAQEIAHALGATVEKAPTALSQEAWQRQQAAAMH